MAASDTYHYSLNKFNRFDVNIAGGESDTVYGEGIFFMTTTPPKKPNCPSFLERRKSEYFYIYKCKLSSDSKVLNATELAFDQGVFEQTKKKAGLVKKFELWCYQKIVGNPSWQFLVAAHNQSLFYNFFKRSRVRICRGSKLRFCQNAKELGIDVIEQPHVCFNERKSEIKNDNEGQYGKTFLVLNLETICITGRTIHKR